MGMAGNAAIPLRKFETCLHGCVNACGRMRVKGGCEQVHALGSIISR